MALPLRAALRSAGRFIAKNPTTMLSMARHALGMRIAVPLDALRWFIANTPPSQKAPQDVTITPQQKMQSRKKLQQYCKTLLKFEPDFVFTHVTRLVPSKGMWRDLRVLEHVEEQLRSRNETAVLFALSQPPGCEVRELVVTSDREPSWP